jgi:ribosome modulation factor
MGDMADMINENFDWEDEDEWDAFVNPRDPTLWKTKEGKVMKIADMTDSHLINALMLCQRKGMNNAAEILSDERDRRKELKFQAELKKDPILRAFMAGWKAGYNECSREAYPPIGMSMAATKEEAWAEYKKQMRIK